MTGVLDSDIHKYKSRDTQAQLCALNQTLQSFNPRDLHKPMGCWEKCKRMCMVSPAQDQVSPLTLHWFCFSLGPNPFSQGTPRILG